MPNDTDSSTLTAGNEPAEAGNTDESATTNGAAVDVDETAETTEDAVTTNDVSDLEIKVAYNDALGDAKRAVELALNLRRTIVERQPHYRGRSLRRLNDAHIALTQVRTFNTEPVPLITPPASADDTIAPAPADDAIAPTPVDGAVEPAAIDAVVSTEAVPPIDPILAGSDAGAGAE